MLSFAVPAVLSASIVHGADIQDAKAPAPTSSPGPASVASLQMPDQANQAYLSGGGINLPQIGEAGADVISPGEEYQIGVQIMNELRDAGAVMDDPLITEYVQNLGHELSSHSDNPSLNFSFFVFNDDDINATSLPGGFIGVNRGLILMTSNEDELAGVIAHEIGHVTQRHLARQLQDQKDRSLINFATMLGAILAATKTNDPNVATGALATAQASIIQHQINFTREDEAEADRVGIATLARAGFSPEGMVDFFAKMQRSSSLNGYDRIPEFLLDHPLDLNRMAEAESRAQQMHVSGKPDSRSYALMRARLRALSGDDGDKTAAYFKAGIASSDGWDQVAMTYGLALVETKAGHFTDAVKIMQGLVASHDDVIAFRIALADALMQDGETAEAITAYESAIRLFPDSDPLILSYADDLITAGKPRPAIELLTPVVGKKTGDPETVRLLAKAYEKSGNTADSHYYMSEYYLDTGSPSAAVDQLRIALATPGIDGMQKQRYKARLERIEEEARLDRQESNGGPP